MSQPYIYFNKDSLYVMPQYWSGTSGLETRAGFTLGVGRNQPGMESSGFGSGNWLQYNVTHFESGETTQTNAMFRLGRENGLHFKYENDYMFNIPGADGGDRYRTAAQQLGYGKFKLGATMFTGDPLAPDGSKPVENINGKLYYKTRNGSTPDKYRAGIGYIGFGDFKIGVNSEKIRHAIQNVLVHDTIGVPRFRRMDSEYPDRFFFNFGSSPYTLY